MNKVFSFVGLFALLATAAFAAETDVIFNTTAWNKAPKAVITSATDILFTANAGMGFSTGLKKNILNFTLFNGTITDTDIFRKQFNYDTLAFEGGDENVQTNFKYRAGPYFVEGDKYIGVITVENDDATNKTEIKLYRAKANKENTFTPVVVATASEKNDTLVLRVQGFQAIKKEVWIFTTTRNATNSSDIKARRLLAVNWETGNVTNTIDVSTDGQTPGWGYNPGKNWFTFWWRLDNDTKATRYYLKNSTWATPVVVLNHATETVYGITFVDAKGYDIFWGFTLTNMYTLYSYHLYQLGDGLVVTHKNFKTVNLNETANTTAVLGIYPYNDGFLLFNQQKLDTSNDTSIYYEVYNKEIALTEGPILVLTTTQHYTDYTGLIPTYTPKKNLLVFVKQVWRNESDWTSINERIWAGILIDNMGTYGGILKTACMFVGLVAAALFAF